MIGYTTNDEFFFASKKVILWKERITWALIWKTHALWSELPPEIYRMIDMHMQKTMFPCFECDLLKCESFRSLYCSECQIRRRGFISIEAPRLIPYSLYDTTEHIIKIRK